MIKPLRHGSRAPLAVLIERQEKKLAEIDEKLGRMMTRRADKEEKLAALYKRRAKLDSDGGSV